MIRGIGTNIVEVVRIGRMIEQYESRFLNRVFCAEEVLFCRQRTEYLQYFAAWWAGKEAVRQLLCPHARQMFRWSEIELVMSSEGNINVSLRGNARYWFDQACRGKIWISVAHCRAYATATALGDWE